MDTYATILLIAADGSETVVDRFDAARPDMRLVNSLMRLQLAARRHGARVGVRDPGAALSGLLDLTGLSDVLRLEPRREAEIGEELGIDEVVQPRDLPG